MSELQAAIFGALSGSQFAVMALGLSLLWGFLKIINLAHFGMILLGAYLTFELAMSTGIDPLLTMVVTGAAMFLLGAVVQAGFERFEVSEFNSLLISYGLLIISVQLVSNIWSADFQRLSSEVNPYGSESVRIAALVFPLPTLIAAVFAIAMVVIGKLVLERTYAGRALQAFGQDRQIAAAFGIDHRRLGIILAGVAGATAAVAGTLHSLDESLHPDAPFEWVGRVFAIVILGGIGNVTGTLYAGLLVGAISGLTAAVWSPSASPFVVFSMVVLALVFRPTGLFPSKAAH